MLWALRRRLEAWWRMFLLVSGRHICAPHRDTNMTSLYIASYSYRVQLIQFINLSKTFLWISPAWNITQTWIFARLFEYSSAFTSLTLDFIGWMVLMMSLQWKPPISSFFQNLKLKYPSRKKEEKNVWCIVVFYLL